MTNHHVSLIALALATSGAPGPVNLLAAMSGARYGARSLIGYALGASLGFGVLLVTAGLGAAPWLLQFPALSRAMLIISGAYLLWLAWQLAHAGPMSALGASHRLGWRDGVLTQWLNPKAWLVAGALVTLYINDSPAPGIMTAWLCMTWMVVCTGCVLAWGRLGALFHRYPRGLVWFNRSMAVVLAGMVVSLVMFKPA